MTTTFATTPVAAPLARTPDRTVDRRTDRPPAQLPIRRHGTVEVPAPGHWPLLSSSRLARSTGRRTSEQLHISDGWLDLDDDPTQCWLHVDLGDRVLDLTALAVGPDPFEPSVWHLHGVADDLSRRDPVAAALRYARCSPGSPAPG
ncbi:MAG: hypothetical protein HZB15_17455 [Actinobacteria bacterium]|nr:hypothetical protein [Actinomycetota bacterium]